MKFRVTQPLRVRWSGEDAMQAAQVTIVADKLEAGLERAAPRLGPAVGRERSPEGARLLVSATIEADSEKEAVERLRYWMRRVIQNMRGITWTSRLVDPTEATVEPADEPPKSKRRNR